MGKTKNKYARTMDDLLEMFSDVLDPADVLTSKLMAQISSAITGERLRLQMSQEKFADHIGVAQSLVSRWEHGNYNFSIRKLSEIAVKLNLDVNLSINPHVAKPQEDRFKKVPGAKVIEFVARDSAPDNVFHITEHLEEM